MSKNLTAYLVTFKRGLGQPFVTYAQSIDHAKYDGLAKFRKRMALMSFSTVDEVVESVTPILED